MGAIYAIPVPVGGETVPLDDEPKKSERPLDISGCYIDNWKQVIIVDQEECSLTVNCEGKPLEGKIDGKNVSVSSFYCDGTVDDEGNVKFTDFGFWQKHHSCTGMGCHDLTGKYIDNYKNEIKVRQTEGRLLVNYGGRLLEGFVSGLGDKCTGTVHIPTFEAIGEIESDGNVKYGDGGAWVKQSDITKDAPKKSDGVDTETDASKNPPDGDTTKNASKNPPDGDTTKNASKKSEGGCEENCHKEPWYLRSSNADYKIPRREEVPECKHPSVTLAPKTFGAMKLRSAKRSKETEYVRNWFSKTRAVFEPENKESATTGGEVVKGAPKESATKVREAVKGIVAKGTPKESATRGKEAVKGIPKECATKGKEVVKGTPKECATKGKEVVKGTPKAA